MNKIVRLNEAQLRSMIKESVHSILTELDWRTYVSARDKAYAQGDDERGKQFSNMANQMMNRRDPEGQYNKGAKALMQINNAKKNGQPYEMSTFYNASNQDDKDMYSDYQNYLRNKSQYIKGQGWQLKK